MSRVISWKCVLAKFINDLIQPYMMNIAHLSGLTVHACLQQLDAQGVLHSPLGVQSLQHWHAEDV